MPSAIYLISKAKNLAYTLSSTFVGCWAGTLYTIQAAMPNATNLDSTRNILERLGDTFVFLPILLIFSGTLHIIHQLLISRSSRLSEEQKNDESRDALFDFVLWISFTSIGALLSSILSAESMNVAVIMQTELIMIFMVLMASVLIISMASWLIKKYPELISSKS